MKEKEDPIISIKINKDRISKGLKALVNGAKSLVGIKKKIKKTIEGDVDFGSSIAAKPIGKIKELKYDEAPF